MERESGFYWVKLKLKGRWVVAEWDNGFKVWWIAGNDIDFLGDEFSEINETRLLEP